MIRFYRKNPLGFAIFWIAVYVISLSLSDIASAALGPAKSVTLPVSLLLSLVLYSWISQNRLSSRLGLCPSVLPPHLLLWYVPLIILASVNLWLGAVLNYTITETLLYMGAMFCAGFLEEVIFRGFLFQALLPGGWKSAVLISSLTFGLGHLVNLFNGSGAELFASLLQVCYAFAVGFLFTILFWRTGSLRACILTHGTLNALSVFANETARTTVIDSLTAAALTILALAYTFYLLRRTADDAFYRKSA